MITFRVDGEPKAQPRPRAYAFHGHARMYDAGTSNGWKKLVSYAAKPYCHKTPLLGPLRVNLHFWFSRPKSHYGKSKGKPYIKESAPRSMTNKPDVDNLAKAVMDALTDVGMWGDDSQIIITEISKEWADDCSQGVQITVDTLEDWESHNFEMVDD